LKKAAGAWLETLVKEGVLTKPLVTALVTAAGERVVELLWRVSMHALEKAVINLNVDDAVAVGGASSAATAARLARTQLAVSEERGRLLRLGAAAAAKQAEMASFAQRLVGHWGGAS
jgi:hypothetical protein